MSRSLQTFLVFLLFAASLWNMPAAAEELAPETRALFRAVNAGDMRAVKKSLLAGADVNGENASGLTPVDVAIDANNFKIAHYLLAWRKHRQSAQRPRIAVTPAQAPEQPAPVQPPAQPAQWPQIAITPAQTPEQPAPVQPPAPEPEQAAAPEPEAVAEPEPKAEPMPPARPSPVETSVAEAKPADAEAPTAETKSAPGMLDRLTGLFSFGSGDAKTAPEPEPPVQPAPAQPVPETVRSNIVETKPAPPLPPAPVPATPTPETLTAVEPFPSPQPSPPERASAMTEPPEPAPENTVAAGGESKAETPPEAAPKPAPEAAQGMFKRLTGFFSFGSEDAKTAPEAEQAAAPEPEAVAEPEPKAEPTPPARASPVETSVAEAKPADAEAPAAEAETTAETAVASEPDSPASSEPVAVEETGPDMLDRLSGLFSFGSGDAKTAPETEPAAAAAAAEPEAEPAQAATREPEAEILPVETSVAEAKPAAEAPAETTAETAVAPEPDSPASSEPVAVEKTGPDMLDRLSGLFSFGSGDAKTAPEPEPAAAAEPEAEPAQAATREPEAEILPVETSVAEAKPAAEAPAETTTETAVAPEPDSPASSEPVAVEKTGPDMLDRLSGLFSFESKVDESTTQPPEEVAPTPTASLKTSPETSVTQTAGLSPSPAPAPETPGAETETAQASPVAAAVKAVAAGPEKRVEPVLGRSLRLGKPMASGTGNVCIEKSSSNSWFCIEPVDWPDEIAAAFQVRTAIYRGTQAIVRYENGAASQYHTLFPAGNFEAIVGYFNASLGAPGKQSHNWAILPAEPNRKNRTVRWRGAGNSVLEIREIDDLRWSSMPDTRHGVVRMYAEDADPVFRHVSWSDFMLARIQHKRR